jgi:glycosyltransferase involved in cell wall biosynthesis
LQNKNKKRINFSIIIPVYNSEKYIETSINSVIKQNYNCIEIIIIDDCSTDKSLNKIKKLKKKNHKIKFKMVKNKKNRGVAYSRNAGLSLATGDYIIFLDSDDYLNKNILNSISNTINKNNFPNLIMGDHNMKSINNFLSNKNKSSNLLSSKINLLNNTDFFTGYCWAFIISRNFLVSKKIKFLNIKTHEDIVFVTKIIANCQSLVFLKKKFYFHTSMPTSLSRKISPRMLLSCIIGLKELYKIYITTKNRHLNLFITERIKLLIIHMMPLLFLVNNKSLFKYSKLINLNKKVFLKINKILKKNIFKFQKNNILLKIKKTIEISTLKKLKKTNKNYFIFCMDKYGYAVSKILSKNNYKVKGFMDNNLNYLNQKKFNINYYKPNNIDKNCNVIICNQRKEHQKEILKQLINYGINSNKIQIKDFDLDLKKKLL